MRISDVSKHVKSNKKRINATTTLQCFIAHHTLFDFKKLAVFKAAMQTRLVLT